ncbi:MAG: SDR family oxidoreductase [Candidatus Omnitrophota bacterium]|nr:SDR family oxidoreductase [Candidatus Omnitrophota bacterium]
MASYLVTGGAGFIGSNIIERLVEQDEQVRVIDSFITGKRENLAPFMDRIELIEGDIRDPEDLKKACKGIDYILHQAALRSVPKSVDDPVLTNDINIAGTLRVLMAAKEMGVKRVVYASSSSIYGDTDKFPQKEEDLPRPISPYAVSKLTGEHYCRTFSATFGLETVSLRYFNVFGPRQNPESKYSAVIPILTFRMLKDEPPTVEWDGKQSRDFTYVGNVVDANLKAAITPGISGEALNVACGNSISINEIVALLNGILDKDIKPVFAPKRRGDVAKTYADINKMHTILNLQPNVQFKDGLEKTVAWFKNNPSILTP